MANSGQELQRQMEAAEKDFNAKHEAIFHLTEPVIPEEVKVLTHEQRMALESFQKEAISRVVSARKQARRAQELAVEFYSSSGPFLLRRSRSNRAFMEWHNRIESLNSLEAIFGIIMGPYE